MEQEKEKAFAIIKTKKDYFSSWGAMIQAGITGHDADHYWNLYCQK